MYTLYYMQHKNLKKIFAVSIFLGMIFFSTSYVFAGPQTATDTLGNSSTTAGTATDKLGSTNKDIPAPDTKISYSINNPLGVTSIEQVIQKIMAVIVRLAVPVIICFFLYTGFMFITAQGDTKKLETAKNMFWQVMVGTIIILGAWAIAAAVVTTVNLITG